MLPAAESVPRSNTLTVPSKRLGTSAMLPLGEMSTLMGPFTEGRFPRFVKIPVGETPTN